MQSLKNFNKMISWKLAIDHSLDFWEDALPEFSAFCINDPSAIAKAAEVVLDPKALCPEPRSLESSELSDSSSEKTGPVWTTEEDNILLEEVEKNNFEWETVVKSFPFSSPRSVKKRWDKLTKNKNKHEWTDEEDKLIMSLYKTHGGNWKKISTFFKGTPPANIKNRFYGSIKKKFEGTCKIETISEDTSSDTIEEIPSKTLEDLSKKEKRQKLQNLYNKAMEIENYIQNAKIKIQELVSTKPKRAIDNIK